MSVISYAELFAMQPLPRATHVFTDYDRPPVWRVREAVVRPRGSPAIVAYRGCGTRIADQLSTSAVVEGVAVGAAIRTV